MFEKGGPEELPRSRRHREPWTEVSREAAGWRTAGPSTVWQRLTAGQSQKAQEFEGEIDLGKKMMNLVLGQVIYQAGELNVSYRRLESGENLETARLGLQKRDSRNLGSRCQGPLQ